MDIPPFRPCSCRAPFFFHWLGDRRNLWRWLALRRGLAFQAIWQSRQTIPGLRRRDADAAGGRLPRNPTDLRHYSFTITGRNALCSCISSDPQEIPRLSMALRQLSGRRCNLCLLWRPGVNPGLSPLVRSGMMSVELFLKERREILIVTPRVRSVFWRVVYPYRWSVI